MRADKGHLIYRAVWLCISLLSVWGCSKGEETATPDDADYVLNNALDRAGTSLADDVDLSPLFLVQRFGAPEWNDDIRVTGSYVFTTPDGFRLTVYDYKQTSRWDEELLSPEEFWRSETLTDFSIGAKHDTPSEAVSKFKKWLLQEKNNWEGAR